MASTTFSKPVDTEIKNLNNNIECYRMPNGQLKELDNADLNTVTQTGQYYAANVTNAPTGVVRYGYLTVNVYRNTPSALYIRQEYSPFDSEYVYVRYITGGSWSNWTSVNNKLAGKVDFVDLGEKDGIGSAFDALTIYARPVLCKWNNAGAFWGLLYKYTGGQYGMGICQQYYQTDITLLSVANGTKTQKTIS